MTNILRKRGTVIRCSTKVIWGSVFTLTNANKDSHFLIIMTGSQVSGTTSPMKAPSWELPGVDLLCFSSASQLLASLCVPKGPEELYSWLYGASFCSDLLLSPPALSHFKWPGTLRSNLDVDCNICFWSSSVTTLLSFWVSLLSELPAEGWVIPDG